MRTQELNNVCSTVHCHELNFHSTNEAIKALKVAMEYNISAILIVGNDQNAVTLALKTFEKKTSGFYAKDCGPVTGSARLWKLAKVGFPKRSLISKLRGGK